MCAACHEQKGVVDYRGDLLCRRCGTLREWAFVISMIQDRLGDRADLSAPTAVEAEVSADPFAAA